MAESSREAKNCHRLLLRPRHWLLRRWRPRPRLRPRSHPCPRSRRHRCFLHCRRPRPRPRLPRRHPQHFLLLLLLRRLLPVKQYRSSVISYQRISMHIMMYQRVSVYINVHVSLCIRAYQRVSASISEYHCMSPEPSAVRAAGSNAPPHPYADASLARALYT